MLEILIEELSQKLKTLDQGIKREIQLPDLKNKIYAVIGMRRTGKTFLLFQKMKQLMANGIELSQILYLNFEDDRLLPMDRQKLASIIEQFYTLLPENHHKCVYLFLDEIQNVSGWPNLVRRLFDTKDTQIFLSGSSAKLLSREISTSLRGRSISIEVYPYNFEEYSLAGNITLEKSSIIGKITADKNKKIIRNYLLKGGFPEIQARNLSLPLQKRILQDYVQGVVFRDIVERHHVSNLYIIHYMIKQLLNNIACPLSMHKLYSDLKSQGIKVSKNTLYDYLSYIEDAYLTFSVPLFSDSIRKIHSNPKKIYAIDTGLVCAYLFSAEEKLGHLFENLVFLDLKKHGLDIFYYLTKQRYEIDFYVQNILGEKYLFQVTWDLENTKTKEREQRALNVGFDELNLTNGWIVTPANYFQFLELLKNFSKKE